MKARQLRFTLPANFERNIGYKTIRKFAGKHKSDNLRSEKSATKSLRRTVRHGKYSKQFYGRFSQCLNAAGYDDQINFQCGRYQESAACAYCGFVARVRVSELLAKRKPFKKKCWQVTVVDNPEPIPEGRLYDYKVSEFRSHLEAAWKSSGRRATVLGQFEFQLVVNKEAGQFYWSPHIHMIVGGHGAGQFIQELRAAFPAQKKYHKPVVAKRLRNRSDVLRAGVYQSKSSTARRKGSVSLSADQKLELHEFLLDKTCSDLLWIKRINFRNSRVQLSTERELDIWHAEAGYTFFFETRYVLRVVPKTSFATRQKMFRADGAVCLKSLKRSNTDNRTNRSLAD